MLKIDDKVYTASRNCSVAEIKIFIKLIKYLLKINR